MRWLMAMILGSTLIVAGCSSKISEPNLSAILPVAIQSELPEDQGEGEFDFGTVLARDQTLRHEFRLTNRSDRPVRLVGSKSNVPCCSHVGTLPELIPAGSEVAVPVFLKVGHVVDRKRVSFEIQTDRPSTETLVLTARFVPEWEVEDVGGSPEVSRIGEPSKRRLKVTCRRKAGEGRKMAPEVVVSSPLKLDQVGTSTEFEGSDGVIEASAEVELTLAGQPKPGPQVGAVLFRWPDGSTRTHEVRWKVNPSLQLSPSVVALKPTLEKSTIQVVLLSDKVPFRIIKVTGPLLAGPPDLPSDAATTHRLTIEVDPARVTPGVRSEIEIVTDHPDQPTLTLDVFVPPREKEVSR